MPSYRTKKALSSVENYGRVEGNYAQLTPIVLKDAQQMGQFKGIKWSDIKSNPKLYDKLVDWYWKRVEDFGVKGFKDKVIWWRAPALYKKTGGDVNKIKDKRLRNIFKNRLKNYRDVGYTGEALNDKK